MPKANRELVVFRKIPSLYFLYEISSDGRIIRNVKSKKQIQQRQSSTTHYYMAHFQIKKKQILKTVHSLVAECWLGPRPDGYEIDHIDRNKHNNHYSNLRYVSHSINCSNVDESEKQRRKEFAEQYQQIGADKGGQVISNPVEWGTMKFESFTAAADYISSELNMNRNTLRNYFRDRRKYIAGKSVSYGIPIVQRLHTMNPKG